jgi:hypothetical protein
MAGTPNAYQLQGPQLSIGYFTGVASGLGPFFYQDAHQTVVFQESEIRTVASELGTLVTVTIRRVIEFGSTTFTLLVPNVTLNGLGPVTISTVGITTLHRLLVFPGLHGQTELYTVSSLTGTASFIPL